MSMSLRAKRSNPLHILIWIASSLTLLAMTSLANSSISSIQSTYRSLSDLSADFVQETYVALLEKNVKEPGKFYMKKPSFVRIDYTGEHKKSYISNGKKAWMVEGNEIASAAVPKEALSLLSGFGEIEELFIIEDKRSYFKLTPKKKNSQYSSLDCWFDSGYLLKKMTIHNNSGNISTYVFNNIKVNSGLDDSLFKK